MDKKIHERRHLSGSARKDQVTGIKCMQEKKTKTEQLQKTKKLTTKNINKPNNHTKIQKKLIKLHIEKKERHDTHYYFKQNIVNIVIIVMFFSHIFTIMCIPKHIQINATVRTFSHRLKHSFEGTAFAKRLLRFDKSPYQISFLHLIVLVCLSVHYTEQRVDVLVKVLFFFKTETFHSSNNS